MIEIGMIVNSEDMLRLAQKVSRKYTNIDVAYCRTYDDSLVQARKYQQQNVRLLVSRGGHCNNIRDSNIKLPMVEIPFMAQNIYLRLLEAQRNHKSYAVVGSRYLIDAVKAMKGNLDDVYRLFSVRHWKDFETQVKNAFDLGYEAVVCGYDAAPFVRRLGMTCYCITMREFEVEVAVREAQKLLDIIHAEEKWNSLFKAMLDTVHEGILSVDHEGKVIHCNKTAKTLLELDRATMVSGDLLSGSLAPSLRRALDDGEPTYDLLHDKENGKYTSTTMPIRVNEEVTGAVVVLQETAYVQQMEQNIRKQLVHNGLVARHHFHDIVGKSPAIRNVLEQAKQYSKVDSTLLIQGESGTGKELIAQSIHNESLRRHEAFVAINCATLPPSLLESELFGYAEGAFTGAKKGGKAGMFERGHNGTIFLDEIGEMSLDVQARLLRVLEERQIIRVGDDRVIPVNIRVIAATNKDLKHMVERGLFREDFYYRLNVLSLQLPPLRDRSDDVLLLAEHYLNNYAQRYGKTVPRLDVGATKVLCGYGWPGNARELKNVAERLVITTNSDVITQQAVLSALDLRQPPPRVGKLADIEQKLLEEALRDASGNKSIAAKKLGISRATFYNRMKKVEEVR